MLKAGEDFGIVVKSIELEKDSKVDFGEIKKTFSRFLNFTLAYQDKEFSFTYEIPWLVNNNFYICGNKKTSILQLFDKPLIIRENLIKIRTNIQTFTLIKKSRKRTPYFYYISFFGKEVPFVFLICMLKGLTGICHEFPITGKGTIDASRSVDCSPDYLDLLTDLCTFVSDDTTNKDKLMSKFFNRKSDNDILANILLVPKVDVFCAQFMHTGNIIDEFIYALNCAVNDDQNYENKRLRFSEQVVYCHLANDIYSMIIAIKNAHSGKKSPFHNNSKVILQNANQSRIVQFDHSLNPLSELAMLTRLSLSGPGGFEKENVPPYLRDIHDSMYGIICPADTGDRENCGTIQYVVPTVQLDDDMTFSAVEDPKTKISIAISHVPFLEHDDATRLQMASSQQRHAIMLQKFDMPLVQSGVESMYTDKTSFMLRAKRDGQVVYLDRNVIVVRYDNGECEAFNVGYRKLYLSEADFRRTYFKVGDTFNAGDVISESNFLKNGRLTLGRNLRVAIMVWYGYNYEDGIVISDKLVKEDLFTSLHYLDLTFEIPSNKILLNLNNNYREYKPIPEVGDRIRKGDVYAKIQTVIGYNESRDVVFGDPHELISEEDCVVTEVKIYCNSRCELFPQFQNYIDSKIQESRNTRQEMVDHLGDFLTQDELDGFLESIENDRAEKKRGNYKIKGDSIDGLRVEITAIYRRPITVGDKIGNRHGNKGVISRIVSEDQMPRFPDGGVADVILNPLGIPSRINIGQLFELHLGMSVVDLKRHILKLRSEGISFEEIKTYIMEYIKIIDGTSDKNYTLQMQSYLDNIEEDQFFTELDDFYVIQPPFESIQHGKLMEALQYTGTKCNYRCFDPVLGEGIECQVDDGFTYNIKDPVAFGYMTMFKLNHIAKDKMATRSIGAYAPKTSQPVDGKGRKGGQRVGEMEVWAIIGHGATENLSEFLTTKSDSIKKRNQYLSEMVNNDTMLLDEDEDSVSQCLRLFQSYLRMLGLDFQILE